MEPDLNPLNEDGQRNLFCPYYRQCLDMAARHQWPFWSCEACAHRYEVEELTDGVLTYADASPVYSLPKPSLRIEG